MTDELDAAQRLDLDALNEEYRRRHGVAVEVIKAEVGPGEEYENGAARALISADGAWFECVDLPMEFSGAAGTPVRRRFVSDGDARDLLDRLHALAERAAAADQLTAGRAASVSLFALYDRAGILDERGIFILQAPQPAPAAPRRSVRRLGAYREGVLPLVFRCRLEVEEAAARDAGVPVCRGVVFCLSGVGERNLVVELPYEGRDLRDLGAGPECPLPQ